MQWVAANGADYPAVFSDVGGAETAVAAWRACLVKSGTAPSSINQALIAVSLLYERGTRLRIQVERVPRKPPAGVQPLSLIQQREVDCASVRSGGGLALSVVWSVPRNRTRRQGDLELGQSHTLI